MYNETGVHAKDSVYRDVERVMLAPPDDTLVLASHLLVVLAEDQADAAEGLNGVVQDARRMSPMPTTRFSAAISMVNLALQLSPTRRSPTHHPSSPRSSKDGSKHADGPDAATDPPSPTVRPAATAAAPPGAAPGVVTKTPFTSSEFGDAPVTILIIGWSLKLPSLLHAFDERLAPGSQAFILGHNSMVERAADLAADGLDLDGNAWRSERDAGISDVAAARLEPAADDAASGAVSPPTPGGGVDAGGVGLRNLRLHHVVGWETDYLALRRLPVLRADLALIIADGVQQVGMAMSGWSEPQMNDSGAMTSSILLRRLRSMGQVSPWQCPSSPPAPPYGASGGSGQRGTPRARPSHWAPSHRLGCSS